MLIKNWQNILDSFPSDKKDIYFTERYTKLYETDVDMAECFQYSEGEKIFLFPYLKRAIRSLNGSFYDLETPYGYAGPIANTNDVAFINRAWSDLKKELYDNKIVCGFIRFNPLLKNHLLTPEEGFVKVIYDRKTVLIDLTLSLDELWNNQIHSKHRNVIRKAESLGLKLEIDEKFTCLDQFIGLYEETMASLDASEFYYFKRDYYKNIAAMDKDAFLGVVKLGGKIVSAAMFLKSDPYAHYHLAASDVKYLNYYPNNFLIYGVARYLKKNGFKSFHLGGGTDNSSENSLYKFKKRFSKRELDFYIGKLMINEELYKKVVAEWEKEFPEKLGKTKNIFLKYRY